MEKDFLPKKKIWKREERARGGKCAGSHSFLHPRMRVNCRRLGRGPSFVPRSNRELLRGGAVFSRSGGTASATVPNWPKKEKKARARGQAATDLIGLKKGQSEETQKK